MFIYLVTNERKLEKFKETGDKQFEETFYIGSKSFQDDEYLGSCKRVWDDINIWGRDAFKREYILEMLPGATLKDLREHEEIIQRYVQARSNPRFYNRAYASGDFGTEQTIWIYEKDNPLNKKLLQISEAVPNGWVKGYKSQRMYFGSQTGRKENYILVKFQKDGRKEKGMLQLQELCGYMIKITRKIPF